MKKNRNNILFLTFIVLFPILIIIGMFYWYFYPRKIVPKFVYSLHIPNESYNLYNCLSFEIIKDRKSLFLYMLDSVSFSLPPTGFNINEILTLDSILNYDDYLYVIIWNKELIELHYSPFLTNHRDGLYYNKKTPLFPITSIEMTDSVYIYSIPKTNQFRTAGP